MALKSTRETSVKAVTVKASKKSPLLTDAVTPWRERMNLLIRGRAAVSVDEAAVILGVGRKTAWKAAKDGSLRTFQVGRRWLVPVGWLEATIAASLPSPE